MNLWKSLRDFAIRVSTLPAGTHRNNGLRTIHTTVRELLRDEHAPTPGMVKDDSYYEMQNLSNGEGINVKTLRLFGAQYEDKAFRVAMRVNTNQRIMLEALRVRMGANTEGDVLQKLLHMAYTEWNISPLEDENALTAVLAQEKRKAS